jgi:serine/threonine protein phosphatase PrpC
MPKLEAWGDTHVGRVRKNNEDNWLVDESQSLALVADGMGGAACGEVASEIAMTRVQAYLKEADHGLSPEERIREAIRDGNRCVWEAAKERHDCEGMGSTIVAIYWELPRIWIANVGDSRAYLLRNGALQQLSYDQNLGNELRKALGYSEEQVSKFAHRNVLTMAIGSSEDVLICIKQETLQPGDEVLLCSDGLSGPVTHDEITALLAEHADGPRRVQHLIDRALEAGGPDNVTVVLLRYSD